MASPRPWFRRFMEYLRCDYFVSDSEKDPHSPGTIVKRQPGGWKCMPYIIGNETFERVASFGLTANFTVYLVNELHMKQVSAANLTNIFSGTTNFAPLVGAFISDAYWGRFRTLAYSSVATFLGMVVLTLTAVVPDLRPPECTQANEQAGLCTGPSKSQLAVLWISLVLLVIGAGGVRPCSITFGADQFDPNTEKGRRGMNSYFNWYYCTSTAAVMVGLTVVVYIQDSISWAIGFGVPTGLMFLAIILFFLGTRLYIYVPPEGSIFTGVAQVFTAAFKKRSLKLPAPNNVEEQEGLLYNPTIRSPRVLKLPLTLQFSGLNKAAIKCEGEVKEDGSIAQPWRLCTVQQVEEVKCLIRIIPVWASGIVCFVALAQQWTFAVLQSLRMDRHLGPTLPDPTRLSRRYRSARSHTVHPNLRPTPSAYCPSLHQARERHHAAPAPRDWHDHLGHFHGGGRVGRGQAPQLSAGARWHVTIVRVVAGATAVAHGCC
ncbi:Proton-dependent oligopeptide transporter family protein [Dioscorea alata]|uniref:Proton-dependent oligopeptide transporter family protein n=1 Tax=Dioscorea alata TaxID=55571 RepID=A0ACB7UNF5_DIOAL|nr:Proton-dependent oligopeptide transporter family protein [Dioscorea alata]